MLRVRAWLEGVRGSLFYVPMLFVVGALALAQATILLDLAIGTRGVKPPTLLGATVESARSLLGTVAGATITFAGIVFSVSLLTVQLTSSQFSPRVLYQFFRDPFSKRVMGVAVGTFTYCLMVLRIVRTPAEANGAPIVPYVSVFFGLVLGIVTVLAIVAFINHSAHSMEANQIIRRIADEARQQIARLCPNEAGATPHAPVEGALPESGEPFVVRSSKEGWVQEVDVHRLLGAVSPNGLVRLDTGAGSFVVEGTPLCTIWPPPPEEQLERAERTARTAVQVGRSRTMQQDMVFGLRQLVDIAMRALSPGVNDPTTAYEAIVHMGAVLRDLLLRDLPPRVIAGEEGRRLVRPEDFRHSDYVELCFNQIRRETADDPAVSGALLETLGLLVAETDRAGLTERSAILRHHARLVLEGAARAGLLEEDFEALAADARRGGFADEAGAALAARSAASEGNEAG